MLNYCLLLYWQDGNCSNVECNYIGSLFQLLVWNGRQCMLINVFLYNVPVSVCWSFENLSY